MKYFILIFILFFSCKTTVKKKVFPSFNKCKYLMDKKEYEKAIRFCFKSYSFEKTKSEKDKRLLDLYIIEFYINKKEKDKLYEGYIDFMYKNILKENLEYRKLLGIYKYIENRKNDRKKNP